MALPWSVQNGSRAQAVAEIIGSALEAVEPARATSRAVERRGDLLVAGERTYDLSAIERVRLVGAGKGSGAMVRQLAQILGDRLERGLAVLTPSSADLDLTAEKIELVTAGHPVPTESAVQATARITRLAAELGERDLLIAAISGGASALLTLPAPGIELADLQLVTELLLGAGVPISQLNAVRKHLSQVKGGQLARLAAPAQVLGLVISDVVGDPLDVIGSGPTAPDPTTFVQAWQVLEKRALLDQVPRTVREHLERGLAGELAETPKRGDQCLQGVYNTIIASNRVAATAAVQTARRLGLGALVLTTHLEGEAREVAQEISSLALDMQANGQPVRAPACVVLGGETTVQVSGPGKGGRNQELALACALQLEGVPDVLVVALGTDGVDGPTDAAGAVATGDTLRRAAELGLDPPTHLARNDAYPFFAALDDLIRTGPTGTNVADLVFVFAF